MQSGPLDQMEFRKMQLVILGSQGIPALHGGFETFAEYLALFMVGRGWEVTVYCQEEGCGSVRESTWNGVRRIHIPEVISGSQGSIVFDFKSVVHSLRYSGVFLTLGYNTAIFNILHRIWGKNNLINMDGIEWRRQKWGTLAKAWLWLNERIACRVATQLIADNPGIEDHLATRVRREKISMVPYGAEEVLSAEEGLLSKFGLLKGEYALLVARPEPENSILELVLAFSTRVRGIKLLVLGQYEPDSSSYHQAIMAAASSEVVFPGSVYDKPELTALRACSRFYLHGHQVGGTNPSLVEALGAGNAVIAHDNQYNRWVAKGAAIYFDSVASASTAIGALLDNDKMVDSLQSAARVNFKENFQWGDILASYEQLLMRHLPKR
jgi:glycosyltransferase involved in cell wall biosynthesis